MTAFVLLGRADVKTKRRLQFGLEGHRPRNAQLAVYRPGGGSSDTEAFPSLSMEPCGPGLTAAETTERAYLGQVVAPRPEPQRCDPSLNSTHTKPAAHSGSRVQSVHASPSGWHRRMPPIDRQIKPGMHSLSAAQPSLTPSSARSPWHADRSRTSSAIRYIARTLCLRGAAGQVWRGAFNFERRVASASVPPGNAQAAGVRQAASNSPASAPALPLLGARQRAKSLSG